MRTLQLPQRAPQRIKFAFIRQFLALGVLDEFKHFLHLLDDAFQRINDLHHLVHGLGDGGNLLLLRLVRNARGESGDSLDQRSWLGFRGLRRSGFVRFALRGWSDFRSVCGFSRFRSFAFVRRCGRTLTTATTAAATASAPASAA